MIRKLLPCLGKYNIYAILAPITVIGEVLLEMYIPLLMSKIIDIGIKNSDIGYIMKTGGLMVLMAIISLALGALSGRFAAVASTGLAKGIRRKLFHKIQDFSFANIDRFSTASLITRITTDVNHTQIAFMMAIRIMVRAPIMLISATIMAISINSRLSLVFFFAIPLLATALWLIGSRAFPYFRKMLKKMDYMNATIQENLIAIRIVKAFVRKDYENDKFTEAATVLKNAQKKAEKILILNMPIMTFTMNASIIAIIWFGGHFIIGGTMQAGEFFSFITYVTQVLISLMMISMIFVQIVLSRASVSRIVEVFDEQLDITDDNADIGLNVEDGSIVFENVSFSYAKDASNLTLTDIDLNIKSGETVGIIGGTGSAKTTLVQLIPRLYDVFDGRILVGGHDIRDYRLNTLRDAVAMVLQNNVLFSGTIKDNLKWGKEDATDEEIVGVSKAAQAHDFIMSFPDGYETNLGQGGVNVSGGQKQRLCIARALLKKPRIIILDDSTSAVDTATDSKIRMAFRNNLKDTTTIIIAQRIASVCEADKIIVLNDGRVDAVGTHEELLAGNRIYREVYESQQKGVA
ncbi:MAG: ABC transporter ATP-binding protein [Clostridiaceae bacterium]|nr:ABC transporter ATP-binding protein [Clostridiaceae bacterium]